MNAEILKNGREQILKTVKNLQAEGRRRADEVLGKFDPNELLSKMKGSEIKEKAASLKQTIAGRLEGGIDDLYEVLGLATKGELAKLAGRIEAIESAKVRAPKAKKA